MKIAMAVEGKGFYGDGIDLAWPVGGIRRVIEVDDDVASWPARLKDRYVAGSIVEVDLEVTPVQETWAPVNRVLVGGSPEAVAHMAEPAGVISVTTAELTPPAAEAAEPTKAELQAHAAELGLSTRGTKAEIAARIEAAEAAVTGDEEPDEDPVEEAGPEAEPEG